jgi:hypothetical protein
MSLEVISFKFKFLEEFEKRSKNLRKGLRTPAKQALDLQETCQAGISKTPLLKNGSITPDRSTSRRK